MKKKTATALAAAALTVISLAGCGGGGKASYRDGTYTARSEVYENDDGSEDGNGYGEVTITIRDNAIVDCVYKTYEPDGTLKDENYGKKSGGVANRDYFNKAQKAVAACDEYASQLIANGMLDGIDAISGATINYNEFVDAVTQALDQAKE